VDKHRDPTGGLRKRCRESGGVHRDGLAVAADLHGQREAVSSIGQLVAANSVERGDDAGDGRI
jgi:hypothetical protein